ncbi:MAG: hypothetical protein R3322_21450 [Kiloniellales bacterium]|jgi:hypothetical protein|nr:hypothetical protein [Kiloniellales bacterium]
MSQEIFESLLWNSRAGVAVRALDLARDSDRAHPRRESATGGRHGEASAAGERGIGLPRPLAAAGLVFLGFVLGSMLVASVVV